MTVADDMTGGLGACLEAVLMVADRPVTEAECAQAVGVDEDAVARELERLASSYDGERRGFALRRTAGGWRFTARAEFAAATSLFAADAAERSARPGRAAMEALAVVAYRQPVTRAQVSAVRGVNSDGAVRALSLQGLVREEGVDPESHAATLVTTDLFLERLGLDSLEALPALAPFLPGSPDEALAGEGFDASEA